MFSSALFEDQSTEELYFSGFVLMFTLIYQEYFAGCSAYLLGGRVVCLAGDIQKNGIRIFIFIVICINSMNGLPMKDIGINLTILASHQSALEIDCQM